MANSLFSWFLSKNDVDINRKTKRSARRPTVRDWTDSMQCNLALTRGLYHNTYPGLKLAGGLAYNPIAVPVWFMGIPIMKSEDENIKEYIKIITEKFASQFKKIHRESHRDGSLWVWPHYSSKKQDVVWTYIPDDIITDILRDIDTGDIVEILTDEERKISIGENNVQYIRIQRSYTKKKITTKYTGGTVPGKLKDTVSNNSLGILPICFANNADGDEVRGHSDYERILTDLKDYHDISLARSIILAKFNPKMVQDTDNVDEWLSANGYASINDIDIATIDLIFNLAGKEKTSFAFPERAYEAYNETLKQIFKKIVEASGVPEITWGLKTEGNNASVEESMTGLINYVKDKQEQKNEAYRQLFVATIRILKALRFDNENSIDIKTTWNNLDAVNSETKAKIFQSWCSGISSIMNVAALTKKQLYNLWKEQYPNTTEEEFEEFKIDLSDMAQFKQFANASYTEGLDYNNGDE